MPILVNRQLFAEIYLQVIKAAKIAADIPDAVRQTMREWRDEYPDLEQSGNQLAYLGQCLSALGFSYSIEIDPSRLVLFADETHSRPLGICLAVTDVQIGRMTKGRHHQVRLIQLLKASQLKWGIITNGRQWRLCYAEAAAPYEVYLEADVDALLDPGQLAEFILFYRFFNREAFDICEQPQANNLAEPLQNLDRMLAESEERTQTIERHLKNRVEQVLKNLCLGFVEDQGKSRLERGDLDEIYRNAIFLLYRMLFLFYAEARRLLPVDHPGYRAISLMSLVELAYKRQIDLEKESDPYSLWKRLTHLCVVVDDGDESVNVRPYNGGLFSDSEKPYLKSHKITDEFLAPVIYDLAYVETKSGSRLIDYRDLSVRHLGTLYEGMLEYRLNLVSEEPVVVRASKDKRTYIPQSAAGTIKKGEVILDIGQVYFADDKGERKSSGSYYTPEDVVQYIVSNTLQPKMQERVTELHRLAEEARQNRAVAVTVAERAAIEGYADRQALEIVEKELLGLRILDPAMGSAHFLVAAGQMLTNFIVETLNSMDWPNDAISTDPLLWKRRVVERCLYGVDINPLAQELAKLALWLSSASEGKPLTFLDHHLKVGNSLYGAPLARLAELPVLASVGKGKPTPKIVSGSEVQSTQESPAADEVDAPSSSDMFRQMYQHILQEMLAELALITTSDSDQIEDVKRKGEVYAIAQARGTRLRDLANVWLSSLFGLQGSDGQPLGEGEYFSLLQEVIQNRTPEEWETFVFEQQIFLSARVIAGQQKFFHWELEFPDAVKELKPIFDIVIANPPYVKKTPNTIIAQLYRTAKCGDLFAWIIERSLSVTGDQGSIGTIVPLSLMFAGDKMTLRKLLLDERANVSLISCDNRPDAVFEAPGMPPNRQRTTITLINKTGAKNRVFTTSYLRWTRSERPYIFKNLKFAEITPFATPSFFPSIGDKDLIKFYSELIKSPKTIADYAKDDGAEFLCVPSAACYYISAVPENLGRRNQEMFYFESKKLRDMIFAIINSNVFYWYWRSRSDGFWVSRDQILRFPIPDIDNPDESLLNIATSLWDNPETIAVHQLINKKWITSYLFNHRIDLLLEIDAWLATKVAPDLKLPRDIFAQFKSNSFLHPLDLSGLEIGEPEVDE